MNPEIPKRTTAGTDGSEARACTIAWAEAPDAFRWSGIVDRVERFNPETRTVIAVVRPKIAPGESLALPLAEGMFCTVTLPARKPVICIRTPRTSVTHEETIRLCVDDRLRTLPVKRIHETADQAFILGEVEEDALIVTTKLINPVEGRLLKPILDSPPLGEPAGIPDADVPAQSASEDPR